MFDRFINQLKNRLESPLPGEETQYLMAPVSRLKVQELSKENNSLKDRVNSLEKELAEIKELLGGMAKK